MGFWLDKITHLLLNFQGGCKFIQHLQYDNLNFEFLQTQLIKNLQYDKGTKFQAAVILEELQQLDILYDYAK